MAKVNHEAVSFLQGVIVADELQLFSAQTLARPPTFRDYTPLYNEIQLLQGSRSEEHPRHSTKPKHLKKSRQLGQAMARIPHAPKKPLNSWMAFRLLFPKLTQMLASPYLKFLWEEDPFKAKWALIAKAYTIVRDVVGRQSAPLGTFLAVVTPRLGIVQAADYLAKMNWTSSEGASGCLVLTQTAGPNLTSFSENILYTQMDERDIVHYCASVGFIQQSALAAALNILDNKQSSLLTSMPATSKRRGSAKRFVTADVEAVSSIVDGVNLASSTEANTPLDYTWTGCMADLYDPIQSNVDLFNLVDSSYGGDSTGTFQFDDPGNSRGFVPFTWLDNEGY